MSHTISIDYFTKDNLRIEWIRQSVTPNRRLSLIKAVIDICRITKDCSVYEKEMIISAVRNKKNSIRRGCELDERK